MPAKYFKRTFLVLWLMGLILLPPGSGLAEDPADTEGRAAKNYSHFSLILPPDWDGEEQQGFVSDDPAEYILTLGKKDDAGDNFLAQLSIYILPNRPGASPRQAAQTLAEAQGDASEPVLIDGLWTFTGIPRSNVIKGQATTYVNTNRERMLIIIAQDPQNLGTREILASLRPLSPEARELLKGEASQ